MKKTKKKVFVVALVVCLLATISMGTLAWFNAQDSVDNQFYIADSDDVTADEIFSVDVYEYTEESPNEKVAASATYKEILPGDVLKKEPHVANTGHYDQYVRVFVTVSDAGAWIAAVGEDFAIEDVFVGFVADNWDHVSKTADENADTLTYVLYYKGILDGSDTKNDTASGTTSDITLFTDVKIPESLTQAQAAAFGADGFSISVKAQAVQTANMGDSAYAAFQTFDTP